MKNIVVFLAVVMLLGGISVAKAAVLSDREMAGVYAGQFDTAIDDEITVDTSSVADQKNIAAIGSIIGCTSSSSIEQGNTAVIANMGNSAVALQTNIASIAGLGTDPICINDGNSISNSNEAEVSNYIVGDTGSVDASNTGSTTSDAGVNSQFNMVSALQSAIVAQNNIATVVGSQDVNNTYISNFNTASINNTPSI